MAHAAVGMHARVVEAYLVKPLAADDYTRLTSALGEIDEALREDTR